MEKEFDNSIKILSLDSNIVDILEKNGLDSIKKLLVLKRRDLKKVLLTDKQINQIIIKMQLLGMDIDKRKHRDL